MNPMLNRYELVVTDAILGYAQATFKHYTPTRRYSGFSDGGIRGSGDFLALVAALAIHDAFGRAGRVCSLELTIGDGDDKDLSVRVGGDYKGINIKASAYSPYRDGLNLFIKEEELKKKGFWGYLQCFVHLEEGNEEPHLHIAGWCKTNSSAYEECSKTLATIPNTGGHKGIEIPCDWLEPFESLVELVDSKL